VMEAFDKVDIVVNNAGTSTLSLLLAR